MSPAAFTRITFVFDLFTCNPVLADILTNSSVFRCICLLVAVKSAKSSAKSKSSSVWNLPQLIPRFL